MVGKKISTFHIYFICRRSFFYRIQLLNNCYLLLLLLLVLYFQFFFCFLYFLSIFIIFFVIWRQLFSYFYVYVHFIIIVAFSTFAITSTCFVPFHVNPNDATDSFPSVCIFVCLVAFFHVLFAQFFFQQYGFTSYINHNCCIIFFILWIWENRTKTKTEKNQKKNK